MAEPATAIDLATRHQVFLERLKAGEAKIIAPFLREIDRYIRLKLSAGELSYGNKKKLERLLAGVGNMVTEVFSRYQVELMEHLTELGLSEAAFEQRAITSLSAVKDFEAAIPSPRQVTAAVFAAPLSVRGPDGGKLLKPFVKGWGDAQKAEFVGIIRQGVFEGATNQEIIKRVRGTKALKFKDGALGRADRKAAAMVRTAVQHVSSVARAATLAANEDVMPHYRWSSVLDSRTSDICQGLDGRVFKHGEGPTPPAHINCRSTMVGVPDKDHEWLNEGSLKASKFGPVPQSETYYSWLKKQPVAFQKEAIGPVMTKLLNDGGLSAVKFSEMRLGANFKPLNLLQMQQKESAAFARAGIILNPKTGRVIKG